MAPEARYLGAYFWAWLCIINGGCYHQNSVCGAEAAPDIPEDHGSLDALQESVDVLSLVS